MKKIFPGYYATKDGRIWSTKQNKYLKTRKNNKGYDLVNISIDGKVKTYSVHRLVAKAFLNNPKNLPTINHKDGNKTDNAVSNLEWTSQSDNELDAFDKGLVDRPNLKDKPKTRKESPAARNESKKRDNTTMKKQVRMTEGELRKMIKLALHEDAMNGNSIVSLAQQFSPDNYQETLDGTPLGQALLFCEYDLEKAPDYESLTDNTIDLKRAASRAYNAITNFFEELRDAAWDIQHANDQDDYYEEEPDMSQNESLKRAIHEELKNVIHKEGGKWKIRGHKGKGDNEKDGDWAADYSTKEKAKAALRAYFAHKG